MVDVDHFKMVNDTFGHLYGDEVLILIANQLQASFRAQDRVFRFGGEEFVVLLRSTTLEHAHRIIDRFRSNVEAYQFPQVGRVTVSVGFVSISPYDSPVVTLGHADQALYYAKTHGRNQVCHYNELVERGLPADGDLERHRRILLTRAQGTSRNLFGSTRHLSGRLVAHDLVAAAEPERARQVEQLRPDVHLALGIEEHVDLGREQVGLVRFDDHAQAPRLQHHHRADRINADAAHEFLGQAPD